MAKATSEYGTAFVGTEETITSPTNFQNISSTMYPFIKQYQTYIANGNIEQASALLTRYPELKNMIIDATVINHIGEEIRNTQIYSLKAGQYTFVQSTEPDDPNNLDVWIG